MNRGEKFRRELLAQMKGKMRRHHSGIERPETAEQRAGRLLTGELGRRKKSDHTKVEIGQHLRGPTTVA